MKVLTTLCFQVFIIHILLSQPYTDYIGAGHNGGMTVTASHSSIGTNPSMTVDGSGLDAAQMDAARFLNQASLGGNMQDIQQVLSIGFEPWIDDQIENKAPTYIKPHITSIVQEIIAGYPDPEDFFGPYTLHFNYAWWQLNNTNQDLLRQKVALALSEILVISLNSGLTDYGYAVGNYYDLLIEHAFGSYEELLMQVTLNPCMGSYLSHLNNPKSDPANNIRPDQNYAREIMQLFTIGLYELNMDGSRKTSNGNYIPTYDNNDIDQMSRIFTGLGGSDIEDYARQWYDGPEFGLDFWTINKLLPLTMYENYHETGPKTIMNDHVINPQGNNTGMEDIAETINYLVNHPNTAPFICHKLIQRLVKSNPSPAYIQRVALVFQNDGNGATGNLGAVVKAILLDPEARTCDAMSDPNGGRLREPIQRYTTLTRAIPTDSPLGRYWNNGYSYYESTSQHPMFAPSVFNFFLPNHQPVGGISEANLDAPEFQIHNSKTSIGYINQVRQWVDWEALWWSWEENDPNVELDLTALYPMSERPEELINHLDILLTHGQLSDNSRRAIKEAMLLLNGDNRALWRTRQALYLMMISPDFNILH